MLGEGMAFVATILGVLLIIEGIPWFLSPLQSKGLLRQIIALPDSVLRFFGLAAMLAGLLIVWMAKQ